MQPKIEILSVDLLEKHAGLVAQLKALAAQLEIGFGWHYLLDLTWILSLLGPASGRDILDAGAGTGLIQWYLADQGARVSSVDRASRAHLSMRFRARYRVRGMRSEDLLPAGQLVRENIQTAEGLRSKTSRTARGLGGMVLTAVQAKSPGAVIIYNHDLEHLDLIPDNSQHAVVAVSALEHNDPTSLPAVVDELLRVLRPGGILLATLGAAKEQDWFHEPSRGWCYTQASLRQIFKLPQDAPSNYGDYDRLFAALKDNKTLREGLADFYFESGDNGMPWGKWDPQYQPVGILKLKPHEG
ncbi:MAG: class I SAM-dependent methyltransferase [Anaerolineales bacterium]|nr:class I SAM-dependent methyltransferase [Anaerolineales bacterium]